MEHNFGPYLEIARIQSEMNRLFDVLVEIREGGGESPVNAWMPTVDVLQTSEGLVLRAEVPGVDCKTLKLSAVGGALVITGDRPRTQPQGQVKFHCMERMYGRFKRVVPLGTPINTRDARATLRDGVLEVFFPKVSNRRGEEVVIPVKVVEGKR
ncbi:MAG TPA: Hsp20/alpha crystallin family protein [Candidatus Polarisedimenticolia bacterium]|nr:Hsp20/alpha crystallin family protein [Candidatus Polarisedimenticolia bacterium]